MSDYQVTNYVMCGECKYHKLIPNPNDSRYSDWECVNENSPYFDCYTDYDEWCEEFEQRGVE